MSMHDVYLLANLLRSSGDQVLNGESKLRLTPTLLHKLNTCFSQIATQDTGCDFHVIPAHGSQLTQLSELDFLHDFLQKSPGLTVSGITVEDGSNVERQTPPQRQFSRNSGDGSILDLSRFRQLHHLEIRGGTIGSVAGVSALRGHIRTLMLIRVGESDFSENDLLRTVLAGCMHFSTDAHKDAWWPALTQLVACYCRLQTLGPCLSLAARLVVLDLSHNALVDEAQLASQLGVLLNLRYLNLSFNRLTCIPELRPELQYLVISHNHISYVDNVENLSALLELNLVMNHFTDHSQLKEVKKMTSLHRLYLSGNPMSFHSQHRLRTCVYLPKHAAQVKFLLDGLPLSKREKEVVLFRKDDSIPIQSHGPVATAVPINSEPSLLESQRSITQSFTQQSLSEQRRNKRTKSVLITNAEEIAEKSTSYRRRDLDKRSTATTTERNTPRSSQLIQQPLQTSTPKEPSPIMTQAAQIMEERLLKMAPVRPAPPPPITAQIVVNSTSKFLPSAMTPPNSSMGSFTYDIADTSAYETADGSMSTKLEKISEMKDDSNYHTADESTKTVRMFDSTSPEPTEEESETFASSQSIESEEEPVDSDSEDAHLRTYVGQLIIDDSCDAQEVFVTVSSRYIKELETDSLKVRERWPLAALINCTSSGENKLVLTFKFRGTPNGISRVYIMEEKSAVKEVRERLGRIIEARDASAINGLKVVQCMQCAVVFSLELKRGNALASSSIPEDPLKAVNRCQWCKSEALVETNGKIMVKDERPKTSDEKNTSKTEPPIKNSLQHSTSDSSIGSCASLGSCGDQNFLTNSDLMSHPPTLVRRCESDIDVISNPSQSSIEVLEDNNRSTPGRKRSSEERQVVAVPTLLPVPESHPPLAGLTESSSSGSMTDSICTTYESGVASTANRRPASGTKHFSDNVLKEETSRETSPMSKESEREPERDPFNAILNGLLKSVNGNSSESKKNVKTDLSNEQIHYDYENLACVDHRLKLHLYLSLLEEMDELQFILRCELFIKSNSSQYNGFLVVSTKKVYLLKVTGPEDRDRIDCWLSRTHTINRSNVRFMTPLDWMAGVHMQLSDNTDIILLLRDTDRTKALLKFSKEAGLPVEDIRDDNVTASAASFNKLFGEVENSSEEYHLELMKYLCSMEVVNKDGGKRNKWDGGAIHVGANVIVLTDDAVWSLVKVCNDVRPDPFKARHSQLTSNLMKVSTNSCRLCLEFVDEATEQQETWQIFAKTERSVADLINSLKLVWEPIFSVPLQILEEHDDR